MRFGFSQLLKYWICITNVLMAFENILLKMVHRVSKKREKEINWKNETEIEGTSGEEHDTMAIRERKKYKQ